MSADPLQTLFARFKAAINAAFPELGADVDPLISASKQAALADFQCNAAMSLAKRLARPPREVAAAIIARLDVADVAEPLTEASIAGPGFINIRLRTDALAAALAAMHNPDLGIPRAGAPETIVVDLCGVNLAKQMHIGHVRSTVIPDAFARALERIGHRVVRQNHVGDWGLPIAMVTARLIAERDAGRLDLATLGLDELERLYRLAQAECERDLKGLEAVHRFGLGPKALAELEEQVAGATEAFTRARGTLLKLQAHDPDVVAIWRRIYDITMSACLATCARLKADITADATAGESSYADELAGIVDDLLRRGIAEESDGAVVVRIEGLEVPCLIRKRDGGFLYATTDVAAIRRRVQKLGASRVVYAVDARQSLHFDQVFGAARKAGYASLPDGRTASLEHAAFGTILGKDGRPFKTRSGENVKLADVIDEAVERAEAAVLARNPETPADARRAIAEAVGVAAIKYADLANDRVKDYIFDYDRMLAFEGSTGPYLLYALVRIRSIFRKAAEKGIGPEWKGATFSPAAPHEKNLALLILRYPATILAVAQSLEPHRLCQYLFDLATAFSAFFDACPVVNAETADQRLARLRLCDLTGSVLADGLRVLGIPTLERM